MHTIDHYCYHSGLRGVNAGLKFAYAAATMLICLISRSLAAAALVLLANGILTVKKGRIPFPFYRKLMLVPLAFLTLGTAAMIINLSKTPLDAYAVSIGSWYLTGSRNGIRQAVRLIGSSLASVSCLYVLSLNTPMPEILLVLEKLHCPELLTELMLLIYRYIFILADTASAIRTSQNCRLGYQDYRTSLRSFGELCAVLFVRALKRSNDLYTAMEARGYDGKIRVLHEKRPVKRKELAAVIVFELILTGVALWIR